MRLFVDANSDTLQVEFQPESNVNPKSTEQKLALKTATPKLHKGAVHIEVNWPG